MSKRRKKSADTPAEYVIARLGIPTVMDVLGFSSRAGVLAWKYRGGNVPAKYHTRLRTAAESLGKPLAAERLLGR